MRTASIVRRWWPAISIAIILAGSGRPAFAQMHIEDLRPGFGVGARDKEGNYKIGDWTPVRVRLMAEKEGFDGVLELSTADTDDVQAAYRRPVSVRANETIDVPTFVKPGKSSPAITVRLVDQNGRTRARRLFDGGNGDIPDGSSQHVTLIVTLGRAAGLDADVIGKQPGYPRDAFRVAPLNSPSELPARWFGYEAVNHLVLCTDDAKQIEQLDVAVQAAIESWVQHGGHLVVSVGESWQRAAAGFLGRMLPADIDGAVTVSDLRELETFLGSGPAIRLKAPLSVPHLTNLRGRMVAGRSDLPIAVKGPYGLGTVTLVALDVGREPFASWEGRTPFWTKLLPLRKPTQQNDTTGQAWGKLAMNDLSSHLRAQLHHFEGVKPVPFQLVALFIFIYILLIGPGDYFLVKKLKRMELTWLTFPLMVIAVSVAAYFTAYWLKGDELRINKVDVVDVDESSGVLRGTSWFTLFSPQIKNYTVAVQPSLAAAAQPANPLGSPPVVLSWLGLAEDAFGGMSRPGGIGVFRHGYSFGPEAQSLIDVPIQVWSMKSFTARWHGQATPTVKADLQGIGSDRVKGAVTNKLNVPLQDCVLAFGRKIYPLGNLPVNGSVVVESRASEDLKGHLIRRATGYAGPATAAWSPAGNQPTAPFQPDNLILTMMFYDRLNESNQVAVNDYFDDLDLSDQLDHQRAILIGRVAAAGGKLMLDGAEATEHVNTATFLRVVLPVKPGAEEPYRSDIP